MGVPSMCSMDAIITISVLSREITAARIWYYSAEVGKTSPELRTLKNIHTNRSLLDRLQSMDKSNLEMRQFQVSQPFSTCPYLTGQHQSICITCADAEDFWIIANFVCPSITFYHYYILLMILTGTYVTYTFFFFFCLPHYSTATKPVSQFRNI